MTGKFKLKVREGISKDPRYVSYPYWYLEVTGENGEIVNITPTYLQLKELLIDIFNHERTIDISRKRRPDASKWRQFIDETLKESQVIKLADYENAR